MTKANRVRRAKFYVRRTEHGNWQPVVMLGDERVHLPISYTKRAARAIARAKAAELNLAGA